MDVSWQYLSTPAAEYFSEVLQTTPAQVKNDMRQIFKRLTAQAGPGCVFSVEKQQAFVLEGATGYADIEQRSPLTADSVFNLASVSKQFTAFAIHLLAREGKLSLDDSIRRYVPELGSYADPVTLRHLLHHSGGLPSYEDAAQAQGIADTQPLTQAQALALLAAQKQAEFAPGTEFSYSNSGYFMLSLVVERVSGKSIRRFSQQAIFTPLQMTHTRIVDQYPLDFAVVRGYTRALWGPVKLYESPWEVTGDGQVHFSVRDLMKWGANLHSGKVGGPDLLAVMSRSGPRVARHHEDYAMGLSPRPYKGTRLLEHSGGWAGYATQFMYFPDAQTTVAVLCNEENIDASEYATKIADALALEKWTHPL
ncbi:serine hydrolase [Pseudomonas sp. B21-035]|uniref:serine hydrolase domain-containing protein n=1 Tax=Pseudomonas sp. B21-035 TaxID=2895484 RepID=UPI00215E845F|nr:serine hydrolase domain-containing protein [Pseudomonas sp. B21-035]UVL58538.1 beta-lactamase family protein [Pseudomonas sp. B21-035]